MAEPNLTIHLALDKKPISIPIQGSLTAEDVCIEVSKSLKIGTLARHLFALRVSGKQVFLPPSYIFQEKQSLDFRIRFKVAHIGKLRKVDVKAYDYYFHQARTDVLENKVPGLVYEKYKKELVGLGITDMYRVILETGVTREMIASDYKKYLPKDVLKKHAFFIKKPIYDNLGMLQNSQLDAPYVKAEYIRQLDLIAPEYLSESYKAVTDLDGQHPYAITVKLSPFLANEPGLKYCLESKKDTWILICTIEDLGFIAIRKDGAIEISRKNGIPFYLKFPSIDNMYSFISLMDGYYRLTCKWTFNLCREVSTPSLKKLHMMKCHGPVGGEFSYAKLESKRANRMGCFIIRESETNYNNYYIDVCMKDSLKPKTFKLERIKDDEFIFNDDLTRYRTVHQLIEAYNDPYGMVYLQECIPPSEYDVSPLLLCRNESVVGDSLTDSSSLNVLIPTGPVCINYKDLQVYKDRRPDGPWCYTISADLIYETCAIPFCSFSQCRATGPGSEYGGVHRRTVSGRKCLKWDKDRSKVLIGGNYTKVVKANRSSFPENSASKAKNYCRNPSGDLGGPWCLVENDEQDYIEKEYCDIPFCDDRECSVFARNYQTYTHYTDFNGSAMASLKFDLKLWNSDDFNNASARLVLSVLALPLTGKEIDVLGVGVEIFISNKQSGLRFGNKDKPDFEDTPGLLTSTNFTTFALSWDRGFITFGVEGRMRPIFLAEIRTKNNLLGFQRDKFDFYSVQGTNVLWNIPFCLEDDECDVHTTTGGLFQRFWPLRQKDIVYDLYLYVRAFHSASLLITASPVSDYPHFKMVLYGPNGFTRFTVKEHEGASEIVLKEIQLEDIVSYWEWSEFSVSFFANSLQIYMKKAIGMHSILEEKHDIFRTLRWFSVGSANGVAHWSFYCAPPEFARPPVALLPECALNPNEPDYKGTQDVTSSGLPCLPWSGAKMLPPEAEGMYPDWTARLQARNYCRDPVGGGQGTFCYALSRNSTKTIEKRFCRLRRCKSQLCKMAGTGNDFIGQVSVTRGNRMCDSWDPNPETAVHFNYMFTFNDSYFAEMKASDARNFCRNPSRDVSGSWCYTTDPEVVQDLCGIKDCDKPEECTVIVSGASKDRKIYVLPQWKEEGLHGGLRFSLKEWNPDLLSGFSFSLYPRNGRGEIELIIGQAKEGSKGITLVYRGMWKIARGKKMEVALKALKQQSPEQYLKEFLNLAGQWAFLKSTAVVRFFGIAIAVNNVSLVTEYFKLGPLDQYLRDNCHIIKTVDLIEAASNLASAVWHLKENDIVHGKIRCRKLMVNCHEENAFTVKLSDPGLCKKYEPCEIHWIPVECYTTLDYAKRSTAADVWALATTLYEIFNYGKVMPNTDHVQTMRWYKSGKRLPQPQGCPEEIYTLMMECWHADPHRRKQPQEISRDINQLLYQVYNSRKKHPYDTIKKTHTVSSNYSLNSNNTDTTDLYELTSASNPEVWSNLSESSFSNASSQHWLLSSQDLTFDSSFGDSSDITRLFSNMNFTNTTSLSSLNSIQSIFELDDECSVVLQGRIGMGFYGDVYKGTLEYFTNEDVRIVAVKKLKSSSVSSCLEDFEREIKIMKTLKHPNIVEILGVLRDPEILLVMEFVQHGSLQSYLKINRETLQTKQLLKYASNIASGMDYLGKKNIVHRDLAARNILVVDDNHVKISDFGLAQFMGTNDYYILKNPNRELPIKWYAPESLGEGKFSVKSDVWSYGVTLYEMFNFGEEPPTLANIDKVPEGQEQQVLLSAIMSGARFPCPPTCPQAIYARLMYPCWQNDPHTRPPFSQVVTEVEDLLTQY